jgi:hypothetical protein
MMSSVALAMLAAGPSRSGAAGPVSRLIVGDMIYSMHSRTREARVADRLAVVVVPDVTHHAVDVADASGEFDGPQRSLYVSDGPARRGCTRRRPCPSPPHIRHLQRRGSGKRLSMALTPPCCGDSKSPSTGGPPLVDRDVVDLHRATPAEL